MNFQNIKKRVNVTITPIKIATMKLNIKGTSPLIMGKMSDRIREHLRIWLKGRVKR
jgi:hypothetical protein